MSASSIPVCFDAAVCAAVFHHARECWPAECCGMIFSSGRVRVCENAQDGLHEEDPAAFPQTGRNAYCFSVDDQLLLARSFDSDDPVAIVYHSHPDGGMEFSAADHRGAMSDGRPLYENLAYLVIGCDANGPTGAALYAFADGDYRRVARFDAPAGG